MGARLFKICSLNWLEWRLIFSSLVLLPYTAVLLRTRGFKRTRANFESVSMTKSGLSSGKQIEQARQASRAVAIAARYGPYRANCLKRSLVLLRVLRRRGVICELKLGAHLEGGDLSAHAWVQHDGIVLNDDQDIGDRFAMLR